MDDSRLNFDVKMHLCRIDLFCSALSRQPKRIFYLQLQGFFFFSSFLRSLLEHLMIVFFSTLFSAFPIFPNEIYKKPEYSLPSWQLWPWGDEGRAEMCWRCGLLAASPCVSVCVWDAWMLSHFNLGSCEDDEKQKKKTVPVSRLLLLWQRSPTFQLASVLASGCRWEKHDGRIPNTSDPNTNSNLPVKLQIMISLKLELISDG